MKRLPLLFSILLTYLFFALAFGAVAAEDGHQPPSGKPSPTPAPRFVDANDGTVTDKLTGLVWLKNANCFGARSWEDAISVAGSLASGQCGLHDGSKPGQWRLPSGEELNSLTNIQKADSSVWLNQQGFSKVQSNYYWTSSESNYGNAMFVDLCFGGIYRAVTTIPNFVWPVRGGQN